MYIKGENMHIYKKYAYMYIYLLCVCVSNDLPETDNIAVCPPPPPPQRGTGWLRDRVRERFTLDVLYAL